MLILIEVADVATKLWAVVLSVSLKLTQSFPDDLTLATSCHASVRELAEINTISQNLVDLLHVVTLSLAVGTAWIIVWTRGLVYLLLWLGSSASSTSRHHVIIYFLANVSKRHRGIRNFIKVSHLFSSLSELELAVLAKKLVTALTLKRFVRELCANNALDLLDHLPLQLVLDLIHLDIERRNGLRPHKVLDSSFGNDESLALLKREAFLFSIHLLLQGVVLPLLTVHYLDRHRF